jgi:hypothetical protein
MKAIFHFPEGGRDEMEIFSLEPVLHRPLIRLVPGFRPAFWLQKFILDDQTGEYFSPEAHENLLRGRDILFLREVGIAP